LGVQPAGARACRGFLHWRRRRAVSLRTSRRRAGFISGGEEGGPCFAVKARPTLKPCVLRPGVDRLAQAGRGMGMDRRVERRRGQGGHENRMASVCAWPGEGEASGHGPWARTPRGRPWRVAARAGTQRVHSRSGASRRGWSSAEDIPTRQL
jgi:hypothetical protein